MITGLCRCSRANSAHRAKFGCAFTLIELLVYLALLAGLSLLVFSFAARTYRFMLERTAAHQFRVRASLTSDLIRRDLMAASPWPCDWNVGHATFKQLTMSSDGTPLEQWVGYAVDEKGLKRFEGSFVPSAETWTERTAALVNAQVTAITLQPIIEQRATPEHGMVRGVTVIIKLKWVGLEQEFVVTVALRNRVIG